MLKREHLISIFTEWERRHRDKPNDDYVEPETAEERGEDCADCFLTIHEDLTHDGTGTKDEAEATG